jgi:hypothetical protein
MITWETALSLLIVPIGALAIGLWVLYINRDLMHPQQKRDEHTPAE